MTTDAGATLDESEGDWTAGDADWGRVLYSSVSVDEVTAAKLTAGVEATDDKVTRGGKEGAAGAASVGLARMIAVADQRNVRH